MAGIEASLDVTDNSDSDEFYDAFSDIEDQDFSCDNDMDLKTSLQDAGRAIDYFFNNQFEDARNLLHPFAHKSLYHSMGNAVFAFLEAVLTFEDIERASTELKKCLELCQMLRKRSTLTESIGNTFKRKNFNQFTDLECHAELCMAEALLMNALLTFIEDENLSSLIRGSLKVRQCYNSFRVCEQIMKHRIWESQNDSESTNLQMHFNSGVHMGIGTFNLMISLLPGRIVKILQFIGFTANKTAGLNMLLTGHRENGLRQVLCSLTLLGYHLMVVSMISDRNRNVQLCEDILATQLAKYPKGLWFLFFKGRLELIKGNLVESELWYQKSLHSQQIWPQFHLLSFWELLWLNSLLGKWSEAELYATYLLQKSKWSRTIYAYQLAAVKITAVKAKRKSIYDSHPDASVDALMLEVPTFKQRIAGKSLPMEKFMIKRAERYGCQNGNLVLPLIELMYLWNLFKFFSRKCNIADNILRMIDMELTSLSQSQSDSHYSADNRALCLLLRGSCYRQMSMPSLALQDLEECIAIGQSGPGLKEDSFLIPYACFEAALCHEKNKAVAMLQNVKKKFSGFALESRLHFRIHAALMDISEQDCGSP
ncbi:tetratricopeptide repeat protein 39B isoform X1 [Drosophila willistoni]|nr:tetratricopeptide repeat protein 39B isoform X1 [Drosophila willistoni]